MSDYEKREAGVSSKIRMGLPHCLSGQEPACQSETQVQLILCATCIDGAGALEPGRGNSWSLRTLERVLRNERRRCDVKPRHYNQRKAQQDPPRPKTK